MRCDVCGKFRKATDLVGMEFGGYEGGVDRWLECRWCMSPRDREDHKMPLPGEMALSFDG